MKKLLYSIAALATIAFAASCSKEAEQFSAPDGSNVTASFQIALPEASTATKAISDGLTAKNLLFYVYDEKGKYLPDLAITDQKFNNKTATISVQLIKGLKYSFGFIAVADGNANGAYTFNPADSTFTVDYSKMTANDDQFDLFTAALNDYEVTGPFSKTITLYRPMAQVNVGSSADDFKAARASGIKVDEMKTSLTFSKVGTAMNFLNDKVTATANDVLVAAKVRPTDSLSVNNKNYNWVAMAYVLTDAEKEITNVKLDAEIENADGPMTPVQRNVDNVPIQRNHRTNILGNIFSVTADFTIVIDEVYDADYDYTNTLQLAFLKGGEVTLDKDEVIDHQLVVPNGSNVILNLNGHTISNTEDIWSGNEWSLISVQGGSLTIKGEGKLDAKENDCFAIDVRDAGTVIIEGGEYVGNITAVYVLDGKADIRGGKYSIKQLSSQNDYRFTVNLLDANRNNGTASAIISGGSFYKFNPGDNLAEGPATNFLKPGFAATQDGDWYNVETAAIPVANGATTDGVGNYTVDETAGAVQAALDAIKTDTEHKNPVITVTEDTELSFGARTNYGNDDTETITIDGGGKVINMKGTDTDWSSFGTPNGTIIIKNAIINKTEGGNGAWNNHALNLTGKVIMENCTVNNSVSVNGEAQFTNVKFVEAGAFYTLIVKASNAGTVTVTNCTFEATNGGRGIKVMDQYVAVADRKQVPITVTGSKFTTAKKAAILVSNTAGTKITWGEGNDISGVAADSSNPVWIDNGTDTYKKDGVEQYTGKKWSEFADLVVCEGCTPIIEP